MSASSTFPGESRPDFSLSTPCLVISVVQSRARNKHKLLQIWQHFTPLQLMQNRVTRLANFFFSCEKKHISYQCNHLLCISLGKKGGLPRNGTVLKRHLKGEHGLKEHRDRAQGGTINTAVGACRISPVPLLSCPKTRFLEARPQGASAWDAPWVSAMLLWLTLTSSPGQWQQWGDDCEGFPKELLFAALRLLLKCG